MQRPICTATQVDWVTDISATAHKPNRVKLKCISWQRTFIPMRCRYFWACLQTSAVASNTVRSRTHQTGWHSGHDLVSYAADVRFEFRQGHRGYPDWRFLWSSSLPQGKCRDQAKRASFQTQIILPLQATQTHDERVAVSTSSIHSGTDLSLN
jgi:hypothetical protein